MAREHARIHCSIWNDDDWRERTPEAQRLYMLLLSQKTINNAGVLPLMVSKWAKGSKYTTAADVEKALAELVEHRFVVVDEDTEEVLVRTFIRNDGVAKVPNVMLSACRQARQVESPRLRSALAAELFRIGSKHAMEAVEALAPELIQNGSETVLDPAISNCSGTVREPPGVGVGEGERSCGVGGSDGEQQDPPRKIDPDNPRCSEHAHIPAIERGPACRACGAAAKHVKAQLERAAVEMANEARFRAAELAECERCDSHGWEIQADGSPVEPARKCRHT